MARQDRPGLRYQARTHSFRVLTLVLVWVGLGAAFFHRPDLIKWMLRSSNRGLEFVGDSVPSPWGDWLEIFLREVGGLWWFQIAILVAR